MAATCGLGLLACGLGFAEPASAEAQHGAGQQLLDLVRIVSTAALVVSLLLGPGIALRAARRIPLALGFLPLPGLGLLAAAGGLIWALAGSVDPRAVSLVVLVPALCGLLVWLLRTPAGEILNREERRALLVVACVFGLVVGRSLWSVGPSGELFGGTVSRTLEVGDRPDSRISFHIVQLITHGTSPYSTEGAANFLPYSFSDRGPLSGLASSPVVLASGASPPRGYPDQPWAPFDAQGFMAYRLAMMALALTVFLSLWTLTRHLGGPRAAYLALLLAATTPFLVHEVWFTWPKLLAGSFVLLAALCLITGRPLLAGVLAGLGYLSHPLALLFLAPLGLMALWPLVGAKLRRPQIRAALVMLAGAAVFFVGWRLINSSHYTQSGFVDYLTAANGVNHASVSALITSRATSLGNSLVPMFLFAFHSSDMRVNAVPAGHSPGVIHFFFQYWNTLPFAVAIVFFPLLLLSLWRAGRRWPWPVFVAVVVPFFVFWIYWGSSNSGLMREGLQPWVVGLFAVVALQQWRDGFPWMRSAPIRALLSLRTVEILAVAMVPTLATGHGLLGAGFGLSDAIAVAAMAGFSVALAFLVWRGDRLVLGEETLPPNRVPAEGS